MLEVYQRVQGTIPTLQHFYSCCQNQIPAFTSVAAHDNFLPNREKRHSCDSKTITMVSKFLIISLCVLIASICNVSACYVRRPEEKDHYSETAKFKGFCKHDQSCSNICKQDHSTSGKCIKVDSGCACMCKIPNVNQILKNVDEVLDQNN